MKTVDLTLQGLLWLAAFVFIAMGDYGMLLVLAFGMGVVQVLSALIHLALRDNQYRLRWVHGIGSLGYFLFLSLIASRNQASLAVTIFLFAVPPMLALFYTWITWRSLRSSQRKPSPFLPHLDI